MIAKVWANRLIAGTQKWKDVPAFRRADVKAELEDRVEEGILSEEELEGILSEEEQAELIEE